MALFVIALLMSMVAIGFVAQPLVLTQRQQDRDFESKGSANLSMLGVLVVFALGIALYAIIGRPDVQSHEPSSTSKPLNMQANNNSEKVGSIGSLLDGLEARLEENPRDGKGWLLLAQSYEVLGQLDDAASAYDKAVALGVSNEALAARLSDNTEETQPAVEIRGRVNIDPAIGESIEPDAVVYVIAKSAVSPMPLAVLRRPAGDLPFDFVLSEENSMVKGAGMAAEDELTITVKVSRSGDALAADTELGTSVESVDPHSAQPLDLLIGKRGTQ